MPQFRPILVNLRGGVAAVIWNHQPILCPRKRVDWSGGRLAAITPGSWESRGIRQQLMAPSIWTLNTAKNASILSHFSQSERGGGIAPEICNPQPCLCPRKRAEWSGGWLAAISAGSWKSRGIHQQLTAPSIWTLNTAKNSSILAHFSQSERGEIAAEIWNPHPCLCPRKRVDWSGGGLAAISPGSWESVGIHRKLTAASIWTLNTAKNATILAHFIQSERRWDIP